MFLASTEFFRSLLGVTTGVVNFRPGASIIGQQVRNGCHTTLCSFIPPANEPQHEPGYLQSKLQKLDISRPA